MIPPTCTICGQHGPSYYKSTVDDGSEGQWFHVTCLALGRPSEPVESLRMTRSVARGYLAAMIDGEGHVRHDDGRTEIINTDPVLISTAKAAAEMLGIPCSVRVHGAKPGYVPSFALSLLGGLKTRQKLLRLPIMSAVKRNNLAKHCGIPKSRRTPK